MMVDAIAIGEQEIERFEAAPVPPDDPAAVTAYVGGLVADPIFDFRTQAVADAIVRSEEEQPGRLGRLALIRPGLGNIAPSPAWIYTIAQRFDAVVVLYTNTTAAGPTELRRVDTIEGVKIPEALVGSIDVWALGSPEYNLISYMQQSDVSLEQLEILSRAADRLGVDVLDGGVWMLAHSQGVNDAVLTRYRLREVGLEPFAKLVGIGGAVLGGRIMETETGQAFLDGALMAGGEQGVNALLALKATQARHNFADAFGFAEADEYELAVQVEDAIRELTDAAFGGIVDLHDQGLVRAAFFGLAQTPDALGNVHPSDGAEDVASTTLGKKSGTFAKVDHILCIEDPEIAREISELAAG